MAAAVERMLERRRDRVGSRGGDIVPSFGATEWNDKREREMGRA